MSVSVPTGDFTATTPSTLFTPPAALIAYERLAGGQRFLLRSTIAGTGSSFVVLSNWTSILNAAPILAGLHHEYRLEPLAA
jgi:hypothetical protein